MNIFKEINNELFNGENIYDSFKLQEVDFKYPHTNINNNCIEKVFNIINPIFWLEIGTMLGGSAIKVAKYIKENNLNCYVICIDPFCGDVNMWCWDKEIIKNQQWSFLKIKEGSPTIRERFMANVCHLGLEEVILPIPVTCCVGVNLLKRLITENRVSQGPQVIYLDSSHQKEETFLEISESWKILKNGGVIFGDDWKWPGLSDDVIKFANNNKKNINTELAEKIKIELNGSVFEENKILIYQNHWFLFKK